MSVSLPTNTLNTSLVPVEATESQVLPVIPEQHHPVTEESKSLWQRQHDLLTHVEALLAKEQTRPFVWDRLQQIINATTLPDLWQDFEEQPFAVRLQMTQCLIKLVNTYKLALESIHDKEQLVQKLLDYYELYKKVTLVIPKIKPEIWLPRDSDFLENPFSCLQFAAKQPDKSIYDYIWPRTLSHYTIFLYEKLLSHLSRIRLLTFPCQESAFRALLSTCLNDIKGQYSLYRLIHVTQDEQQLVLHMQRSKGRLAVELIIQSETLLLKMECCDLPVKYLHRLKEYFEFIDYTQLLSLSQQPCLTEGSIAAYWHIDDSRQLQAAAKILDRIRCFRAEVKKINNGTSLYDVRLIGSLNYPFELKLLVYDPYTNCSSVPVVTLPVEIQQTTQQLSLFQNERCIKQVKQKPSATSCFFYREFEPQCTSVYLALHYYQDADKLDIDMRMFLDVPVDQGQKYRLEPQALLHLLPLLGVNILKDGQQGTDLQFRFCSDLVDESKKTQIFDLLNLLESYLTIDGNCLVSFIQTRLEQQYRECDCAPLITFVESNAHGMSEAQRLAQLQVANYLVARGIAYDVVEKSIGDIYKNALDRNNLLVDLAIKLLLDLTQKGSGYITAFHHAEKILRKELESRPYYLTIAMQHSFAILQAVLAEETYTQKIEEFLDKVSEFRSLKHPLEQLLNLYYALIRQSAPRPPAVDTLFKLLSGKHKDLEFATLNSILLFLLKNPQHTDPQYTEDILLKMITARNQLDCACIHEVLEHLYQCEDLSPKALKRTTILALHNYGFKQAFLPSAWCSDPIKKVLIFEASMIWADRENSWRILGHLTDLVEEGLFSRDEILAFWTKTLEADPEKYPCLYKILQNGQLEFKSSLLW